MKFVVLTDTHFVARGRRIYGLDPAERLAAAIACINRDHRDLAFVIVTGDLAHWGEDAAYEHLADVLALVTYGFGDLGIADVAVDLGQSEDFAEVVVGDR